MGQSYTIDLIQPYHIKAEKGISEDAIASARRLITEQLIMGAANQLYPDGMGRADAKIFQHIADSLADETPVLDLNSTQFAFLCELFQSNKAAEKLKFAPHASGWFLTWTAYLDTLQRGG